MTYFKDKIEMIRNSRREGEDMSIVDKFKYRHVLKAEKIFFKEHGESKFGFFGYLGMQDGELPVFLTAAKDSECNDEKKLNSAEMVYAFTPAILKHCVSNFTDEYRAIEAKNISGFVEKCTVLSNAAVYMNRNWDTIINELANDLQYGKSNENLEKEN